MKKLCLPVVLLALLLGGCATPQTLGLRQAPPAAENVVVELKDVPFFAQEDHQCGPAALATMLQHSGRPLSPEALTEQVYLPGRKGSLAVELAAAARRQGRLVYSIAPQLEALLAALHQGHPVLVLQNNGLRLIPFWHYAVVVGADREREVFILRSGRTERLEVPFTTFERTWARADYLGLLVLDPATVPDTLDPRAVIRELALMERAGAVTDAQAGFNRALLNWPEQKSAWVGLASTSMRLGEADRAESTLRELVRRAPDYGPGLNNLADLLLKTGRPLEALPLAQRAVAVLDIPATRATLQAAHQAVEPVQSEALPPLQNQPAPVAEKKGLATSSKAKARKAAAKRKTGKTVRRTATKEVKPVAESSQAKP
jgi:tetratricopeptide (TPR) repeat protein